MNCSTKWYFYKPPLRALEDICADILALENRNEELLGETIGGGK